MIVASARPGQSTRLAGNPQWPSQLLLTPARRRPAQDQPRRSRSGGSHGARAAGVNAPGARSRACGCRSPIGRVQDGFDRQYWLAHCNGFRVDAAEGRLGFVEDVGENVLVVRAGRLGRRLLLVAPTEVAFIVPRARGSGFGHRRSSSAASLLVVGEASRLGRGTPGSVTGPATVTCRSAHRRRGRRAPSRRRDGRRAR